MKAIALLILSYFILLYAQGISYNEEFQVNTYTNHNQTSPNVSCLTNGGFVVCWNSYGQDGSEYGIFAQLFNKDGSPRGSEFQVNTYTNHNQTSPNVCCLTNGGFVVCWNSYGQDGSEYGIFAQLFNKDGSPRGSEFQVNTFYEYDQRKPNVTNLADSGFVVCWERVEWDSSELGIYSQLFNNDGSKRGSEFQVNTYTESYQQRPSVVNLINGGFVICWDSYGQDGSLSGIYGQLYNKDGSRRGSEFQVNTYTENFQSQPYITNLLDGGFIVCWTSIDQDGSWSGIFGQLYNNDGLRNGSEFQVNTYTESSQANPSVAKLADGGFVVCWESDSQDGSHSGIFGQLYNNDRSQNGSEFQVNTYFEGDQAYHSITSLADGGFLVCWESDGQDSSWRGIYGKYYLDSPINHPLQPFSPYEPSNDKTLEITKTSFKWGKTNSSPINFSWELEYKLYLDDNNDFMHPQIISGIYDTICVVDSLVPGTTYWWKVLAKNIEGDSLWSLQTNAFFVSHNATGIKHQNPNNKFQTFKLYANYPNPFNPETTIKYNLPADQSVYQVKVKIYNALGQLITTLINEPQNPGMHTVKWNGENTTGQIMPSGIYFCVVQAGRFKVTQKMLLVR